MFAVVTGKGNGDLSPWGREDDVHGGGRGWRRIAPTGLVIVEGSDSDSDSTRSSSGRGAAREGLFVRSHGAVAGDAVTRSAARLRSTGWEGAGGCGWQLGPCGALGS